MFVNATDAYPLSQVLAMSGSIIPAMQGCIETDPFSVSHHLLSPQLLRTYNTLDMSAVGLTDRQTRSLVSLAQSYRAQGRLVLVRDESAGDCQCVHLELDV